MKLIFAVLLILPVIFAAPEKRNVFGNIGHAFSHLGDNIKHLGNQIAHGVTDTANKVEKGIVDAANAVVHGVGDATQYLTQHSPQLLAFVEKLRVHIDPKLGAAGCAAACPPLAAATAEFAPITGIVCQAACPLAVKAIG